MTVNWWNVQGTNNFYAVLPFLTVSIMVPRSVRNLSCKGRTPADVQMATIQRWPALNRIQEKGLLA